MAKRTALEGAAAERAAFLWREAPPIGAAGARVTAIFGNQGALFLRERAHGKLLRGIKDPG